MNYIRKLAVLFLLLLLMAGCAGAPPTDSTGTVPSPADDGASDMDVSIRGDIVDIQAADGTGTSVRIEGEIEPDTAYDAAVVSITEQTKIYRQTGSERREVTADELASGQRVEAVFTGPVMESYPVQATASQIVILE